MNLIVRIHWEEEVTLIHSKGNGMSCLQEGDIITIVKHSQVGSLLMQTEQVHQGDLRKAIQPPEQSMSVNFQGCRECHAHISRLSSILVPPDPASLLF
jgi:hypothetical protein